MLYSKLLIFLRLHKITTGTWTIIKVIFFCIGDGESNWNHFASLSGSDFDLAAHGDHQDIRDLSKHVVSQRTQGSPGPEHV